jgi:arabinan endo-1,5-alpha-L-arabinosidase
MMQTPSRRMLLKGAAALGLATGLQSPALARGVPPLNDRLAGDLSPVHDPVVIRQGDIYYLFCTTIPPGGKASAPQIPWRWSRDLVNWKLGGHVFPHVPGWAVAAIPGITENWAPDISYVGGEYRLYYACSTGGSIRSAIGLATNRTLDPAAKDFGWIDRGLVLVSKQGGDFNAIDPAFAVDRQGKHWLAFGSFWSGLKIVELDKTTGKPPPGPPRLYSIARRNTPGDGSPFNGADAIEAPFLIERGEYYYLFASYDYCCQAARSTYYTAVGRAKDILGPYVDREGRAMMQGFGTVVLCAGPKSRWRGPGHCAILREPDRDYIVYHAYDGETGGAATLRIAPLEWSADGWPSAIV